jgi:zinc protease
MSASLPSIAATAGGVLSRDLSWLLADKDDRFRYPVEAEVAQSKLADLRAVIDPQLKSGPIDITVVGDVTTEQAIAAVRDTFAALPKRASTKPKAVNGVRFPSATTEPVALKHNGRPDQALAVIAWPTLGMYQDLKRARSVNILQDIIQNRMVDEIRVAQGATYSPQGESRPSEVYPGYGILVNFVETPPSKVDSYFTTAKRITADLRDHPPTADELARALNPRLERIIKAQQTNGYWVGRLAGSILDPKRLTLIRTTLPDYRKVSAKDVQRAAKAYLSPRTEWRLVITSNTPPAADSKSTPPAK